MANNSRPLRNRSNKRKQDQVNLVSARSRSNPETNKLSRLNVGSDYSQIRKKRTRNKKIVIALSIVFSSLLVAVAATAIWLTYLSHQLSGGENFSSKEWTDVLTKPEKPSDPFWMLLLGTDEGSEPGIPRTDTMILARVDPASKTAAMVSIPRDTLVDIPGHGKEKINAAYTYGELEKEGGGIQLCLKTVSELTGVDIAYFAQINFNGVIKLVDDLGGVTVDVPVDIVGDREAGNVDLYTGRQTLNGEEALVFCRSRAFDAGDYQRQANQRTFLQALAKQVLSSNPAEIATSVNNIAGMTFTNMGALEIVKIAQSMQGLQESAIHTYTVPSTPKNTFNNQGVMISSYVIADEKLLNDLISSINKGAYPPPQEGTEMYNSTESPDSYKATSDGSGGTNSTTNSNVNTSNYKIDVRNGCGINGSATSISDKMTLAGYVKGEIGNTDAYIYDTTLIIYKEESGREVANDIKLRIGYGKVVASEGRYTFTGDVLIVVGDDYKG